MEKGFKFRDDLAKSDETVPLELTEGPYKGVVYRYTTVGIREEQDESAVLRFQYELYSMGDHTETSLRKDQKFENTIGLILNSLILEATDDTNAKRGKNDPQNTPSE